MKTKNDILFLEHTSLVAIRQRIMEMRVNGMIERLLTGGIVTTMDKSRRVITDGAVAMLSIG